MEKRLCSTQNLCMCPAACVSHPPQYKTRWHTHTHTSISVQTTEPHMEKPSVKHSEECAESNASCGRHKWCFVWVEDSGIQPWPLFDVLEAFNVPPLSFFLQFSYFTCQESNICSENVSLLMPQSYQAFSGLMYNVWTVQCARFNSQMPPRQQWNIRVYKVKIGVWASLCGLGLFSVGVRALPPPEGSDISAPVWGNSVDRQ